MIPLWRLSRNRYARRFYESVESLGIVAARMLEYEADTSGVPAPNEDGEPEDGDPDDGVSYLVGPATDEEVGNLDLDFTIPVSYLDGEWVVAAVADGRPVGRTLVSTGARPHVYPLGQDMSFDGAYVRRVFVAPEWRNRGIARRMVRKATVAAGNQLGADAACALIAPDNRPSQWVFEANGYRPVRRHDYARVFRWEWRRVTPVEE